MTGEHAGRNDLMLRGHLLVLVLTLVVTPVAYPLFDHLQQQRVATRLVQRLRGRLSVPNPVTPA